MSLTPEQWDNLIAEAESVAKANAFRARVRRREKSAREHDPLRHAAERAVMWFEQFACEPEDYTVMHELQAALGQEVDHQGCRCEVDA